jgi:hypothetical protein
MHPQLPKMDQSVFILNDGQEYGPYVVIEITEDEREFVYRADADGNDASGHPGECGVDWEYIYINPQYMQWRLA